MAWIEDYSVYTTRMKQSIYDKMFWIDKIFDDKVDTILDFGCANGELINAVHSFLPDYKYVGYDLDPAMIEMAKESLPYAHLTSNWNDISVDPEKTIVVLSSVIHEVYSYGTEEDVQTFWDRITGSGFKYIVIRDMLRDDEENYIEDSIIDTLYLDIMRNSEYGDVMREFETIWGPIKTENDLKHFFLKYRYKENWARESHENYLPIAEHELKEKFHSRYNVLYEFSGNLPYLVHQIRQDFKIDIKNWKTHLRLIWKLK